MHMDIDAQPDIPISHLSNTQDNHSWREGVDVFARGGGGGGGNVLGDGANPGSDAGGCQKHIAALGSACGACGYGHLEEIVNSHWHIALA